MSLALFKLLATVVTGTGVGGVTGPFAYAQATKSDFEKQWKRTLNVSDPIISCENSDDKYILELILAEDQGKSVALEMFKEKRKEYRDLREKEGELEWVIEDNWGSRRSDEVVFKWQKKGETGSGGAETCKRFLIAQQTTRELNEQEQKREVVGVDKEDKT